MTSDIEQALTEALDRRAADVAVRPDLAAVISDAEGEGTGRRSIAPIPLRRRRPAMVTVAAAAIAAAVGAGVVVTRDGSGDDPQPLVAASATQAGITEGMGRWSSLASGPEGMASGLTHGSALSDGRVLFWGVDAAPTPGDTQAMVDGLEEPDGPRASLVAFAVYAPADGSWDAIDTAPVSAMQIQHVVVAGDRLLVVGSGLDRVDRVAMYDASTDRWTTSVVPGTDREHFDGVAFTGEVAVLVRLNHGMGDQVVPDWSGSRPSGEEPAVWRWSPADDAWVMGEAPPLAPRANGGWAFDGERLAVVGGADAADLESGTGAHASGAVYDVASDRWSALPDAPWPAMHPGLAWDGDRLVYAGGTLSNSVSASTAVNRLATWSPDEGWRDLPAPPPAAAETDAGPASVRLTDPLDGAEMDRPGSAMPATTDWTFGIATVGTVFVDGSWEDVPVGDPMTLRAGDLVVATSSTVGGAVDEFQVAVRGGSEHWVHAAPSPISDIWRPALVLVGDDLYVVGAPRESTWQDEHPVSQAWVLDLGLED